MHPWYEFEHLQFKITVEFPGTNQLNFIKVCSSGSNQQQASIGLDNGLAPTRRQAIIWTNGG